MDAIKQSSWNKIQNFKNKLVSITATDVSATQVNGSKITHNPEYNKAIFDSINTYKPYIFDDGGNITSASCSPIEIMNYVFNNAISSGSEFIRPEDFGAIADGITDNKIAIDNMIAYTKANGSTVWNIGKGTYLTTGNHDLEGCNNLTIKGSGASNSCFKLKENSNHTMFYANVNDGSIYNFKCTGVKFDLDYKNQKWIPDSRPWYVSDISAIVLQGTNLEVSNCEFVNCPYALSLVNSSSKDNYRCVVRDNYFHEIGIAIDSYGRNFHVENNTIHNCLYLPDFGEYGNAIVMESVMVDGALTASQSAYTVTISAIGTYGQYFSESALGKYIRWADGSYSYINTILSGTQCLVNDSATRGSQVAQVEAFIDETKPEDADWPYSKAFNTECVISNNTIRYCYSGISLVQGCVGVIVTGNTIANCVGLGISTANSQEEKGIVISNNTIRNVTQGAVMVTQSGNTVTASLLNGFDSNFWKPFHTYIDSINHVKIDVEAQEYIVWPNGDSAKITSVVDSNTVIVDGTPTTRNTQERVLILGSSTNTPFNYLGHGIVLAGNDGVIVTGNTCEYCSNGIYNSGPSSYGKKTRIVVSNNICSFNRMSGIVFYDSNGGQISDNLLYNNNTSQDTAFNNSGILIDRTSKNVNVIGNTTIETRPNGQRYCVFIGNGSGDRGIRIFNNKADGTTLGEVGGNTDGQTPDIFYDKKWESLGGSGIYATPGVSFLPHSGNTVCSLLSVLPGRDVTGKYLSYNRSTDRGNHVANLGFHFLAGGQTIQGGNLKSTRLKLPVSITGSIDIGINARAIVFGVACGLVPGDRILIKGAGSAGADLNTTICSVTDDGTSGTINDIASSTIAGSNVYYEAYIGDVIDIANSSSRYRCRVASTTTSDAVWSENIIIGGNNVVGARVVNAGFGATPTSTDAAIISLIVSALTTHGLIST